MKGELVSFEISFIQNNSNPVRKLHLYCIQWRSQEFQSGGLRGGYGRGVFLPLRVWGCAPGKILNLRMQAGEF
jgi:hypothetical protein